MYVYTLLAWFVVVLDSTLFYSGMLVFSFSHLHFSSLVLCVSMDLYGHDHHSLQDVPPSRE